MEINNEEKKQSSHSILIDEKLDELTKEPIFKEAYQRAIETLSKLNQRDFEILFELDNKSEEKK